MYDFKEGQNWILVVLPQTDLSNSIAVLLTELYMRVKKQ